MINRIVLLGYLGSDPDLRTTTDGTAYAVLQVVLTEKWFEAGQGRRTRRVIPVKIWDERYLRILEQQGRKDLLIYLEGRLALRRSRTPDGHEYMRSEVTIPRGVGLIKFIDPPASAFAAPLVEEEDEGEDGSVAALGSES